MTVNAVVSSHGADFFGQDQHPARVVQAIAEYLPGLMPADHAVPLVQLLTASCARATATAPETATVYAERLALAARHRFMRPALRLPARRLAAAAARAAGDGQPWTLQPAT